MYDNIMKVTGYGARLPHFHRNFPLILFWSQKSGCTSLANWFFYQVGLYETAMEHNTFIHHYEFEIYINRVGYFEKVIREIAKGSKETVKLVRNPYKRAVSSFVSLITPPGVDNPQWIPIREFIYSDGTCRKPITFKHFLLYLYANGASREGLDPHHAQQYIEGEEKVVNKYIYLEDYKNEIRNLESKYGLKEAPLEVLSNSWHHQATHMIFEGMYAEADITDPLFPRLPTYKSFYDKECIQLVTEIFYQDFITYNYPEWDNSL